MAAAKHALRTLARRIQSLEQEIEVLLSDLDSLTQAVCPGLRQTNGVGVDSAVTLLTAAGDNRNDFAAMQGSRHSVEPVRYQPARGRRIDNA